MSNKLFKRNDIRKFLNETYEMASEMYRCDCNNCPVCDQQRELEGDYDYDYEVSPEYTEDLGYDLHPGEAEAPPRLEPDGSISPEELHSHFDVDGDGRVDMHDYAQHVDYHCEHPEILEDYLELKDYRRDDVHCHDSYSKCCDHLMQDKSSALNAIKGLAQACGASCPASTASALADVLELLKSKNLID